MMDRFAESIWDMKYRLKAPDGAVLDATIADTWRRVASAVAAAEKPERQAEMAAAFYRLLEGYRFLPAGRILAGAGANRAVTLFNCFVMGTVEDSLSGIFEALRESALTMQQGGGIGVDFSTLRPKGAAVKSVGADASGPISFMDVWDAMCRTIMSAGSRRGAMMGTLACDHPDIEAFVEAKRDPARLRNFNISVLVSDALMAAVAADAAWPLSFGGAVYRTISARGLWERIMRGAYDSAEPGVIFIDRINAANNLSYCETIRATNPCGEQPLPAYGACLLGSVNLAALVRAPFSGRAAMAEAELAEVVRLAVRFLDNVVDVSNYPLARQAEEARAKRRIGLGVTGLADALIMCGLRYDKPEATAAAQRWMALIEGEAYRASAALAAEKGPFPRYDRTRYLALPRIAGLPEVVRAAVAQHGLRNGLLTSIAPTGTISLIAGNVSSGVEPVFAATFERKVLLPDGSRRSETVTDFAVRRYRELTGEAGGLPPAFITSAELKPRDHLAMQAALQRHVDSAISKTINCPEDVSYDDFKAIYAEAYGLGLKGCTAFRPNPITGAVLSAAKPVEAAAGGAEVVQLKPPLAREEALAGVTYKLKWPDSDHAIYITVNDIVQDGRRRPFEIFINSKNMEHYAWTVALTRMISAVFRRGGDVAFVVEELKAVFDPRGGQWLNGRYVPSLLAAIGGVVERHMIETGFLHAVETPAAAGQGGRCPRCSGLELQQAEGCAMCLACGYSQCG